MARVVRIDTRGWIGYFVELYGPLESSARGWISMHGAIATAGGAMSPLPRWADRHGPFQMPRPWNSQFRCAIPKRSTSNSWCRRPIWISSSTTQPFDPCRQDPSRLAKMITHIPQRAMPDCAICTLAMVMGGPYGYERVLTDSAKYPQQTNNGKFYPWWNRYLNDEGFLTRYRPFNDVYALPHYGGAVVGILPCRCYR
jgi:hypothetical protein